MADAHNKKQNEGFDVSQQMSNMFAGSGDNTAGEVGSGFLASVDFSKVADGGGGKLLDVTDAAGNAVKYEWRIVKIEEKMATTGNKMATIQLETVWPLEDAGVKVYDQCVYTNEAMWKIKSLIKSAGLMSADGTTFVGNSLSDLQGKIVCAGIKHDTYQGTTRNKIASAYEDATKYDSGNSIPSFG